MKIIRDSEEISIKEIDEWEMQRIKKTTKFLCKKISKNDMAISSDINIARKQLAELKTNIGEGKMHSILKGTNKNVQEVIEAPAGLFIQTQFFIEYGNDKGLKSKIDKGYPFQATGRCCLKNGTCIGGVRHQMKDEVEEQ